MQVGEGGREGGRERARTIDCICKCNSTMWYKGKERRPRESWLVSCLLALSLSFSSTHACVYALVNDNSASRCALYSKKWRKLLERKGMQAMRKISGGCLAARDSKAMKNSIFRFFCGI